MIVNLTPHPIAVRTPDGTIDIPPSGQVARLITSQIPAGETHGVPVVSTILRDISGLPGPRPGTVYLVSSIVAQAVPDRRDVVAPDTGPSAVRDENGQIVAVTRLQRFGA